jgi:hypothetical protein
MLRKHTEYGELDDALNRLYLRYQEAYAAHESGRVGVTARTHLPTGDIDRLKETEHGAALTGFLSLLPRSAVLSISTGRNFDILTLTW